MEQNTSEWLEWRKKHVGASDQTHLHWSAPWSIGWAGLWDIKMGRAEEQIQTPHMERGLKLEDEARLAYSFHKNETFTPQLVESKEFPHLACSLDARSESGKTAEIKCPGEKDHATAQSGSVPKKYIPQLCHQLFVTGSSRMDYVSFYNGTLVIVPFNRDEKLVQEIISAANLFWTFIKEERRPIAEYPHADFDTRITEIDDKELLKEASWNLNLRSRIEEAETMLNESNKKILSLCSLDRAKVGGLQIVTTERKGLIQYDKVPLLQGVDLDLYRGEPKVTRSIRKIKE